MLCVFNPATTATPDQWKQTNEGRGQRVRGVPLAEAVHAGEALTPRESETAAQRTPFSRQHVSCIHLLPPSSLLSPPIPSDPQTPYAQIQKKEETRTVKVQHPAGPPRSRGWPRATKPPPSRG